MYYNVLYVVITMFLYIKKRYGYVDIMEKYMSYLEVFL